MKRTTVVGISVMLLAAGASVAAAGTCESNQNAVAGNTPRASRGRGENSRSSLPAGITGRTEPGTATKLAKADAKIAKALSKRGRTTLTGPARLRRSTTARRVRAGAAS